MLAAVWRTYDACFTLQEQDEGDSSTVHYHFVQQALQPLVEMLLKLLSKQEEGQDEDDGIWNLSLAGGNCLSLVAAVVGDEVLALVMPYIQVCFSPAMGGFREDFLEHVIHVARLSCHIRSPCYAIRLLFTGI